MTARMTAGEAFYLNRIGNSNYCVPWNLLLPNIKEEFESNAARVLENAAAIRERMGEGWQPIATRPEFDQQPIRQFIIVEGWKEHSGSTWHRVHSDLVYILREDNADSMFGYRRSDMVRIMKDGDMDGIDRVTHWMPGALPRTPKEPVT